MSLTITNTTHDSFKIFPFHFNKKENGKPTERIRHDNVFEMIWINKGFGWHAVNGEKFAIQENSFFCVKPDQSHFVLATEDIEGITISFNDSFLYKGGQDQDFFYEIRVLERLAHTGGIELQEALMHEMRDIILRMNKEYQAAGLFRNEILNRYLKILLVHLARQFESFIPELNATSTIPIVHRFMLLLEQHYKTCRLVAEYAGMLSVTPNYLNIKIKAATGFCVKHHIRERILLEAKNRAAKSGSSMKEVAYCLGFDDLAYFSRYFKRSIGVTFSEFRLFHHSNSII